MAHRRSRASYAHTLLLAYHTPLMDRRPVTNTVIVTNVADYDPRLIQFPEAVPLEVVALPKFGRIIVICPSHEVAATVKQALIDQGYGAGYSLQDNKYTVLDGYDVGPDVDYLELPLEAGSRRFLISPPRSPPAEWNHWDREEEEPNQVPYLSQDLSHLLWEKLGGGKVQKIHDNDDDNDTTPKVTTEVLLEQQQGVPAIIIDSDDHVVKDDKRTTIPKTSLPL